MQPLFEHRKNVAGYATRMLELEGDGPPILLVHGFSDSADTWRLVLDRLGRANRRALAVDLPGYGKASRLQPGPVLPQYDAFASELVRRLADETGEPVVIAGNSLGGVVALRVAQDPDLPVAGVVPIGPAGMEMPRWFDVIERDPLVRTLLALPVPIPSAVLRPIVGQVFRQLAFARPNAVEGRVIDLYTAHHPNRGKVSELLANGRRLLPELSPPPFEFERIQAPVRLVWGTKDRMVNCKGAKVVEAGIPHTEIVLLEGEGHCPQIECPDRIFELLMDFRGRVALAA